MNFNILLDAAKLCKLPSNKYTESGEQMYKFFFLFFYLIQIDHQLS